MTAKLYSLNPKGEPERPVVDVSGCLNGYRVWVMGRPFEDFPTLTAASRVASAMMTLESYGLLERVVSAQAVARAMLEAASVAEINNAGEG